MFVSLAVLLAIAHGPVAAPMSSVPITSQIPGDFVALTDVAPTIEQDIRYATAHNFTGRAVPGYGAAECWLTRVTAEALKSAQKELNVFGLGIKVYDCYRPHTAVQFFAQWAQGSHDVGSGDGHITAQEFYPRTAKSQLHALGYIAHRSGHSRGSTVDLTLVPFPPVPQDLYRPGDRLQPCTAPQGERFMDNSLDMGTGFDCLDPWAHTECPEIGTQARRNRLLLRQVMRRYGMINYAKEWWHYTYFNEPHKLQAFDFAIRQASGQNPAPHLPSR